MSKLKEHPKIHMTSKNKIEYIEAIISYDKIIMKPKTFLKTRHVLSRIKRKQAKETITIGVRRRND